jgi:hypothetical protein
MSRPYKGFEPKWIKGEFSKNSYRSIFKWGDPLEIKAPKESLYKILKEKFELDDNFFSDYKADIGFDEVKLDILCKLLLFKLKGFKEGEMCLYLDLPTVRESFPRIVRQTCAGFTKNTNVFCAR